MHEPELWPLILLTEGQLDRIIVGDMFTELLDQKLYNTLPIGHAIAAWFLRGDDLTWLNKEYQKMFEFFKDSPALQWMEESVLEEARKKTEQQLLAEQKKADQRVLAEQKKAQQQLLAEQKKALMRNQQTVVELVVQRFPTLKRLARAQARTLDQPELFQQAILRLAQVRDIEEAQDVLFSLSETEEPADK